ncbi:MAG: flagellar basal-body rod protein FlgG [Rhodospirillaceae bacterium]|jgi:flagellar basal-body rod protein FlgG|nr:flagellar basal-body rod protein FlgG [Rhodospirillaceae bacterium]MBT5080004.1 flagellar basal-body rod protein FlgG [Rhodospirillaceae bacterium]MBT6218948.1 flagellar basal-body rod protein FlgG [Rhodospirillaceae bacterium]MBT6588114.1 flagellar basal-body rod protein FlgG [Rhodospirillaceae bacterium]
MRSLSIAATGMLAQQLNVEVISNNIANMNTTGFRRQRAEFQDLLYQNLRRSGTQSSDTGTVVPAGVEVGTGVKTSSVYRISEQGNLQSTDNTYDVAIQGKGFFRVTLPSGEDAYTRAGSFQVSADGQLVTTDGDVVAPGITIPADTIDVSINRNGEVSVKVDGTVAPTVVGQLEMAIFFNDAGLEAKGGNTFMETPASGTASAGVPGSPGYGSVLQGFLETSNVNAVSEITSLITAQRAYEMNSRVITASDEMLRTMANLR